MRSLEIPVQQRAIRDKCFHPTGTFIEFTKDEIEQSNIQKNQSSTITAYVRDGFTADSAVDAVQTGDVTKLVHTGLTSVQLQAPMTDDDDDAVTEDDDATTVEEEAE